MNDILTSFNEEHFNNKQVEAPRLHWENLFKRMNENGDDRLLIDDVFEDENLENL